MLAPETPTLYPGNYLHPPDLLDIVLTNLKITPETLSVLQELDSDYNSLLCEWDASIEHQSNWYKPTIRTTDWTKYKSDLQQVLPRNKQRKMLMHPYNYSRLHYKKHTKFTPRLRLNIKA
uniref:Uncharacterized protein n=1 Tax=Timema tahoe TaxID=61484 RepID=A0A7R9FIB7_9NEOP|nr:unnamed protein product [Timema tahoe]